MFLFSNERSTAHRAILEGKNHAAGFWGMVGMDAYDIDATFLELEHFFSKRVADFLRRHINVYFIHVLLFPWIVQYDIVYTSAAFGTQFIHILYPFRKPLWVMHDFSIASLIGERATLKQKLFRFMTARAGGIVTIGSEEATRLRTMFPHLADNIAFIPYGADLEFFKPSATIEKKHMVFAVGRDPDRDWRLLVGVAPALRANVVIATRERRIAHLRPLPPNVLTNDFSVEDLILHYQEAKVFVLPLNTSTGLNDAMGVSALYEALSLGKAIVATNTHTMRSYIQDGENGLLVPEHDANALRDALRRVLADDALRLRLEHAARKYAEEHLELTKQTGVLATYFKNIAAGATKRS